MKIHSMWDQYPLLQGELVATNELLKKKYNAQKPGGKGSDSRAPAFRWENAAAGLLSLVFVLFPAAGCGTGAGNRGCIGVVAYGYVDA